MRGLIAAAALLLSACANLIEATPSGGVLKVTGNKTGSALRIAQAHCVQFGKNARISSQNMWNNTVTFDCV